MVSTKHENFSHSLSSKAIKRKVRFASSDGRQFALLDPKKILFYRQNNTASYIRGQIMEAHYRISFRFCHHDSKSSCRDDNHQKIQWEKKVCRPKGGCEGGERVNGFEREIGEPSSIPTCDRSHQISYKYPWEK